MRLTVRTDESKFQRLRSLAAELKMILPESFVTVEVFSSAGERINYEHMRSRSWVRNAYNAMMSQLGGCDCADATFGAGLLSIKDTGGTIRFGARPAGMGRGTDVNGYWSTLESTTLAGYRGASASNTYGIVLGTGVTAESFEDYSLAAIIANGTGSGQMSYVASETPIKEYDAIGKVYSVTHGRFFNNNSAGAIVVGECGLYAREQSPSSSASYIAVLRTRDVLPTPISVPSAGQVKVTYTFALTYPS